MGMSPEEAEHFEHRDRFPQALAYLWQWFVEICEVRGSNGFGPNCITYPDIAAWAQLTGSRPTPWDVGVLRALDRAWMTTYAGSRRTEPEGHHPRR